MGLFGTTGYLATEDIENQPGIMSGRFDDQDNQQGGCYVPLRNATINWWLSVKPTRIIGVFRVGSNYSNMYVGLLNRFATDTEYPYPLYIAGCTTNETLLFSSSDVIAFSGMTDPFRSSTSDVGPGRLLRSDGSWSSYRNSSRGSGSTARNASFDRVVYPCGRLNDTSIIATELADDWMGNSPMSWDRFIPGTASSSFPVGSVTRVLKPTPATGGDLRLRVPATLIETNDPDYIAGEMDGVFWFPAFGGLISEDRLVEDSGQTVFRVFQNGNRTEQFSFFCVRED